MFLCVSSHRSRLAPSNYSLYSFHSRTLALSQSFLSYNMPLSSDKRNETAVVNGIGIFNSWPRNFPNPRDAMFDLLDNAVDAAHQEGRISIAADDRSSGIIMLNSCAAPVKPLHKVLELYTSEKQFTGAVGENGIGLKQGVVTLANVSFIISKNHSKYSIGIVATSLQTYSECWLPSFELKAETASDLEQELFITLDSQPRLRQCVSSYGDTFLDAVRRLMKTMLLMNNAQKGWKQYPHVFCLLMHDLKHGENLVPEDRVKDLLKQTKIDLPKHYLHIPKNLIITVGSTVVKFNHWQPRLVEMTVFDFHINRSVPMEEDPWWQYPEKSYDPTKYYPIRIYIGFDAERAGDDSQRSTGSLYIYSRKCGRLIRSSPDARGEIGVSNGGTDYCQGLTIILDDSGGNLPLNPTKHDVAFSEHADGVIHRANLYCYINAVTRFYYNYFKEVYFFKKKREISDALKDLVAPVKEEIALAQQEYTPISLCEFNTFDKFLYTQTSVKNNKISKLLPWKDVVLNRGKDNVLFFTKLDPPADTSVHPEPTLSATSQVLDNNSDDNTYHTLPLTPAHSQRSTRKRAAATQSPPSKRARASASTQMTDEQSLPVLARVSALEDEVAKLKERIATQENLENEIVKMKSKMEQQIKLIARLETRFKDFNEVYEC